MSGPFGKIHNKNCCCGGDPCCPDRCIPKNVGPQDCANPLPLTLTVEFSDPSAEGCFDISGTVTLLAPYSQRRWGGTFSGTCTWCSQTWDVAFDAIVSCNATAGWQIEFDNPTGTNECLSIPPDATLSATTCDPIYLTGDLDCFLCAGFFCEIPDPPNPPISVQHDPFCLSVIVYEEP